MTIRRNSRSILPLMLIFAGMILVLGAGIYALNPFGTGSPAATATQTDRIPYADITRVSLADAKAAYDLGQAVFLDVRGEPYFSDNHIPGALSISEDDLANRLNELDPNAWIIPYCT